MPKRQIRAATFSHVKLHQPPARAKCVTNVCLQAAEAQQRMSESNNRLGSSYCAKLYMRFCAQANKWQFSAVKVSIETDLSVASICLQVAAHILVHHAYWRSCVLCKGGSCSVKEATRKHKHI
jgi:hypothetical protein